MYDKYGAKLFMTEAQHRLEDELLKENTVRERVASPAMKQEIEVPKFIPTYKEYDMNTTEDELMGCKSTNL